jgi:uncharacterized GH25 family protein
VLVKGEPVAVAAGSPEVTLKLPPTGSLVLKVVDAAGKPVPEQTVYVEHESGIPMLSFDADGKGEVRVRHLPVGKWVVEVVGRPERRAIEVKPGAELKLTMKP